MHTVQFCQILPGGRGLLAGDRMTLDPTLNRFRGVDVRRDRAKDLRRLVYARGTRCAGVITRTGSEYLDKGRRRGMLSAERWAFVRLYWRPLTMSRISRGR